MYWMIASFSVSVLNLLLLGILIDKADKIQKNLSKIDVETGDEDEKTPESGMNLMLLKPGKRRKARRFTDKTRDWITEHETASRR